MTCGVRFDASDRALVGTSPSLSSRSAFALPRIFDLAACSSEIPDCVLSINGGRSDEVLLRVQVLRLSNSAFLMDGDGLVVSILEMEDGRGEGERSGRRDSSCSGGGCSRCSDGLAASAVPLTETSPSFARDKTFASCSITSASETPIPRTIETSAGVGLDGGCRGGRVGSGGTGSDWNVSLPRLELAHAVRHLLEQLRRP